MTLNARIKPRYVIVGLKLPEDRSDFNQSLCRVSAPREVDFQVGLLWKPLSAVRTPRSVGPAALTPRSNAGSLPGASTLNDGTLHGAVDTPERPLRPSRSCFRPETTLQFTLATVVATPPIASTRGLIFTSALTKPVEQAADRPPKVGRRAHSAARQRFKVTSR